MHDEMFVRNTYLKELFDHVSSPSRYIWVLHHILLVSTPQKKIGLQRACSDCAENALQCTINFGKAICPLHFYLNMRSHMLMFDRVPCIGICTKKKNTQ
jgi:hypothetical protein